MKRALASLLLLPVLLLGCRKPEPVAPPPAARIEVAFLDRPVTVAIGPAEPTGEGWFIMDAGAWEPLALQWTGPAARARVERTAPDWVSVQSPRGQVYRTVVRNPDTARSRRRMDDEEIGMMAWSLLWLVEALRP